MKYIDADKLIAEIERRLKGYWEISFHNAKAYNEDSNVRELKELRSLITSLQQEQPEELHFTPLNRLIQKIPSENWNDTVNNYAKKLCDCLTKEGYLKDAAVLQGYISYMNGDNVPMATMDEQEQPEDTENKQKPIVQWPNLSNCKHDCKTCFAKCFYRKEQNEEQQPKVDLEEEIDAFFDKWDKNSNGCIFDENGTPVTIRTIKGVVKHFLNARKEE